MKPSEASRIIVHGDRVKVEYLIHDLHRKPRTVIGIVLDPGLEELALSGRKERRPYGTSVLKWSWIRDVEIISHGKS